MPTSSYPSPPSSRIVDLDSDQRTDQEEHDEASKVVTVWQVPRAEAGDGEDEANANNASQEQAVRGVRETVRRTRLPRGSSFEAYQTLPRQRIRRGLVFEIPLVERADGSAITHTGRRYGPRTRACRYVVIKANVKKGVDGFVALPIRTYGNCGVMGMPGDVKETHAIIHTTRRPPPAQRGESPQRNEAGDDVESGLLTRPIRVIVPEQYRDDERYMLSSTARLNFGAPAGFDYGVRMRVIGQVDPDSDQDLVHQYRYVWREREPVAAQWHPPESTPGNPADDFLNATTAGEVQLALIGLRVRARENGLDVPPAINQDRAQYLADRRLIREYYLSTLQDLWRSAMQNRDGIPREAAIEGGNRNSNRQNIGQFGTSPVFHNLRRTTAGPSPSLPRQSSEQMDHVSSSYEPEVSEKRDRSVRGQAPSDTGLQSDYARTRSGQGDQSRRLPESQAFDTERLAGSLNGLQLGDASARADETGPSNSQNYQLQRGPAAVRHDERPRIGSIDGGVRRRDQSRRDQNKDEKQRRDRRHKR